MCRYTGCVVVLAAGRQAHNPSHATILNRERERSASQQAERARSPADGPSNRRREKKKQQSDGDAANVETIARSVGRLCSGVRTDSAVEANATTVQTIRDDPGGNVTRTGRLRRRRGRGRVSDTHSTSIETLRSRQLLLLLLPLLLLLACT